MRTKRFVRFSLFDRADIGTRAKETEGGGEGRGQGETLSFPLPPPTKWKHGGVVLYVLHQLGRRLIGSEIRRSKVEWRLISASVALSGLELGRHFYSKLALKPLFQCVSGQASHPKGRLGEEGSTVCNVNYT